MLGACPANVDGSTNSVLHEFFYCIKSVRGGKTEKTSYTFHTKRFVSFSTGRIFFLKSAQVSGASDPHDMKHTIAGFIFFSKSMITYTLNTLIKHILLMQYSVIKEKKNGKNHSSLKT